MKKILNISEDEAIRISYGALAFLIAVFIAFSAWMSSVDLNARELKSKVEYIGTEQLKFQEEVQTTLHSIDKRTTRIETLLEQKKGE